MADFNFYPAAQQIQQPDILGSYLRGVSAPGQLQAQQQGLTAGGLQIDQLRLALQKQGLLNQVAGQMAGQGAPNTGSTGGIQNGPQASGAQSTASPQGVAGYSTGTDPSPGFSQGTMRALGLLAPEAVKGMEEGRQAWLKQAQLSAQMDNSPGSLSFLRGMVNNPNADQMLVNNPPLMAMWAQLAPKYGIDPRQITSANVQRVASEVYNSKAIPLELPTIQAPAHWTQSPIGLGGTVQTQDLTGEQKAGTPRDELQQVMGKNGPLLVPRTQAAGMTPFNASIFGASSVSDQAKEFAYQKFVATGEMPAAGRSPAMQAAYMNYFAQRADQDGNSAASIAAKGQAFKAGQGVLKDFESGQTSKTLNGINTAVQHMSALDPLIANLDNTNSPAFNTAANFFKRQTGSAAPTNFAALKEFVAGEVAKAVLPGGGGEGERQALAAPLSAANSPQQLQQAVQTIKTALAGKTEALRNQWDIGTNGTQGDFNKFLLPETKKALGIGGSAPSNAPGGQYKSADDVKAAFQAGTLSRSDAKQILSTQFGMQ